MDEKKDSLSEEIEEILRDMDLDGTLKGMWFMRYAIEKDVQDPGYTAFITKGLYIDVAEHFHTTPSCVERNIRSAVSIAWASGKVETLFGRPLERRPSNGEFIDMVSYRIRRGAGIK